MVESCMCRSSFCYKFFYYWIFHIFICQYFKYFSDNLLIISLIFVSCSTIIVVVSTSLILLTAIFLVFSLLLLQLGVRLYFPFAVRAQKMEQRDSINLKCGNGFENGKNRKIWQKAMDIVHMLVMPYCQLLLSQQQYNFKFQSLYTVVINICAQMYKKTTIAT